MSETDQTPLRVEPIVSLRPVPRGMCSAFYEFMGAGGTRMDDGTLLMLAVPAKLLTAESRYSSAMVDAETFKSN